MRMVGEWRWWEDEDGGRMRMVGRRWEKHLFEHLHDVLGVTEEANLLVAPAMLQCCNVAELKCCRVEMLQG